MNRWSATILVTAGVLVAGCAPASTPAAVATVAPTASTSPWSAAEITASPSTTAAPTASATAAPSPSPRPESFHIAWHRSTDPATPKSGDWDGSLGWGGNATWTKLGDLYVVPVHSEQRPVVWSSPDLLHWTKATLPSSAGEELDVTAVTIGGPGLVAIGAGSRGQASIDPTWTSADGKTWKRVSDSGLSAGQKWLLQAVGNGNVTFTAGAVDVTVYRGTAFDSPDFPTMVVSEDGLTAFVNSAKRPVEMWQAIGTTAWRKLRVLPHSTGGYVRLATRGPRGWFVEGCNDGCATNGWTSRDGITWLTVTSLLGRFNAIVADGSGFIAVGERNTGTSCAVGEDEIFGETWTSVDGRRWRRAPDQAQFNRASIRILIVTDRTLFGIGTRYLADRSPRSTVWTADLPADSLATGPTSIAPPLDIVGCGP